MRYNTLLSCSKLIFIDIKNWFKSVKKSSKPKINNGHIFSLLGTTFIFNIITTNKNSTAIAPTYTINSKNARNSAPNKIRIPVMLQKTVIRNSTECTAFDKQTTIVADIKAKLESK